MQAQLRYLDSPDITLASFQPIDPSNFGFLVQAFIGPQGQQGEESFDIMVCTPQWLLTKVSSSKYVWGHHYLFMNTYSYDLLREAIEQICREAQGSDWTTIASILQKYAYWEFDGYQESSLL